MFSTPVRTPAALAALAAFLPNTADAQAARQPVVAPGALTDIIVVSARPIDPADPDTLPPPSVAVLPPDAAGIAARTAGGALIGNGALAGQLSYRGLSGERVLGRVNGQRFATGGPNAMDPPLHYAPSILVDRIEVARGVAPVADGPSLAGAVNAVLRETGFGSGPRLEPIMSAAAQGRSVDEGLALGVTAGLASERWRLGITASHEQGEDYRFPGGTVGGTLYGRSLYGVHGGFRTAAGELFAEYRRSETDPSGNPPFALDTVYFNTDFIQTGFSGRINNRLEGRLRFGHVAVRHLMDNQTLRRPAAPLAGARATFAEADTSTIEAQLSWRLNDQRLTFGGDAEWNDRTVRITNPLSSAFFIEAQPRLGARRTGGFAEWRGRIGRIETEWGLRVDRIRQDAGIPQLGAATPMGPRGLAAAFIAGPRNRFDTTVDAVLRSWLDIGAVTPRLVVARKTRVPSLLERFAWLPTEASYGLADGNIYVGDPSLRPETAWMIETGFDWVTDRVTLRPTFFHRRVDRFIQGVPFDATPGIAESLVERVAAMNGDATPLRFANADAALTGADLDFEITLAGRLSLEGTASWVRARRRDIDDNLYRVAPANIRIAALWLADGWTLGTEMTAAAAQRRVSVTNGEAPSPGYAVFGVFGRAALTQTLALEAGIENLFDRLYRPHLSGLNRVGHSDVGLGERLPGAGRGIWLRLLFRP